MVLLQHGQGTQLCRVSILGFKMVLDSGGTWYERQQL